MVPRFSLEAFGVLICSEVEPMSDGSDSVPLLMALLFSVEVLVKYGANLVSDFDPVASCFGE
jgi:hypothetical protein